MKMQRITTPPGLVLDENSHTYYLGNAVVPSVTQILQATNLSPDWSRVDPWYAERGKMVHKAIELLEQKRLDWSTVDERIRGFMLAYSAWKRDFKPVKRRVERLVFNREWGYAGKLDLYCMVCTFAPCGDFRYPTIIDVKCGEPHRSHGYQTAGYGLAVDKTAKRACLYLKPNGTYKLVEYPSHNDFRIFLAAVTVYHNQDWRAE